MTINKAVKSPATSVDRKEEPKAAPLWAGLRKDRLGDCGSVRADC
jgi:hypothetical protein